MTYRMKRKRKANDPWRNRDIAIAAIIGVLFLLSFVMFSGQYNLSPAGQFTKTTSCYDSDKGLNFERKGAVVILNENEGGVAEFVKEDFCDNGLNEFYCDSSTGFYKIENVDCVCDDGKCVS